MHLLFLLCLLIAGAVAAPRRPFIQYAAEHRMEGPMMYAPEIIPFPEVLLRSDDRPPLFQLINMYKAKSAGRPNVERELAAFTKRYRLSDNQVNEIESVLGLRNDPNSKKADESESTAKTEGTSGDNQEVPRDVLESLVRILADSVTPKQYGYQESNVVPTQNVLAQQGLVPQTVATDQYGQTVIITPYTPGVNPFYQQQQLQQYQQQQQQQQQLVIPGVQPQYDGQRQQQQPEQQYSTSVFGQHRPATTYTSSTGGATSSDAFNTPVRSSDTDLIKRNAEEIAYLKRLFHDQSGLVYIIKADLEQQKTSYQLLSERVNQLADTLNKIKYDAQPYQN